ncbi:hypothetical protein Bca4012_063802 [Brassica carinata]
MGEDYVAFGQQGNQRRGCGIQRINHKIVKGQLVGKTGELKNGEANRKRLKISVPHFDNTDLIKSYSRTLIGRCMNPDEQVVKSLLMMRPKIGWWRIGSLVYLGMGKFQLHFENEEDLVADGKKLPSEIPFWIYVVGVPTEFWSAQTFQSIGDAIGETTDVDLDHGKIRVVLDGFKELCFETTVDFTGGEFYDGEQVPVSLKYKKLFRFSKTWSSLCHHEDLFLLSTKSPVKKNDSKEDIENWRDDRARSYKGVVLHG